ncbi:2-C-methyl-D-erythritol 4-phosphate cytidylyltransferase [Romboutsia maritimum]|uniref:2-C-methyl-D-erythritol 4-phosphate cytidylyltransferase n=1 Tax=Romboutsia maritimum TaxID=2020948 RepID=A0A371IQL5_9FIRM|nr:2-C-methyl-D-erythritol 4-phosphate cytidylyltransferase [Romboutsia maritimum]RDY22753.1 2-C-methyl-D-erythritol 4-phosphate cytidylyltransferase [Romboutsia maritimum]
MNGVIIVAAGSGSRMNANKNKQFIKINGKEIIAHTLEKFYNNKQINNVVVVIKKDELDYFNKEIINKYGFNNIKIAFGGNERQDSVYNGLKMLDNNCKIVLIHDGARPFVTDDIIENSILKATENKAVVVGVPVKDTIKIVDEKGSIIDTPNRNTLWAVQTPQTFDYDILIKSYERAFKDEFYGTDDAMLVERIGYSVKMIKGSYNNIKITTPEDINIGTQILELQNL